MRFDAYQPYCVYVKASSQAHFESALSLAFNGKYATGYGDYGDYGLVFYWFSSTMFLFEPNILKSKNENGEYILHHPTKFHKFPHDTCVGEILGFSWDWVCNHPIDKGGEYGFEVTTDAGENGTDILCIVRRTYTEYHYE
jgi:hypothetical protein